MENCTRCHEIGRKLSAEKCLACHTALRSRVRAGEGLHSRRENQDCANCHVEHQGRDYALIWWGDKGRASFDHQTAGWKLEGRHDAITCELCHRPAFLADSAALSTGAARPSRTFLGLRKDCRGCHRDPHAGRLGSDCAECHRAEGWGQVTEFDHARTGFPLLGLHRGVACPLCHPTLPPVPGRNAAALPDSAMGRKWTGLPHEACSDCHADPHAGRLGTGCSDCHGVEGWGRVVQGGFDHDRTRYPLQGKHASVRCPACHKGGTRKELRFAACRDCHEDPHLGQFDQTQGTPDCAVCHTVDGYKTSTYTVERHAATRFPLKGAHLAIPCSDCHSRPFPGAPVSRIPFRFASLACVACHPDPHRGQASKWIEQQGCEACHSDETWRGPVFDHGRTRFPLEGGHARSRCGACHVPLEGQQGRGAVKLQGLPMVCAGCHADPHAGQFRDPAMDEVACERCHGVSSWQPVRFDHNRDAAFKLEGAHARAACTRCHPREGEGKAAFTRYRPLGKACTDCHRPEPGLEERRP